MPSAELIDMVIAPERQDSMGYIHTWRYLLVTVYAKSAIHHFKLLASNCPEEDALEVGVSPRNQKELHIAEQN